MTVVEMTAGEYKTFAGYLPDLHKKMLDAIAGKVEVDDLPDFTINATMEVGLRWYQPPNEVRGLVLATLVEKKYGFPYQVINFNESELSVLKIKSELVNGLLKQGKGERLV